MAETIRERIERWGKRDIKEAICLLAGDQGTPELSWIIAAGVEFYEGNLIPRDEHEAAVAAAESKGNI